MNPMREMLKKRHSRGWWASTVDSDQWDIAPETPVELFLFLSLGQVSPSENAAQDFSNPVLELLSRHQNIPEFAGHNYFHTVFTERKAVVRHAKPVTFKDMDWVLHNLELLMADYPDMWIAVKDRTVVAYADTVRALQEELMHKDIRKGAYITRTHKDAWVL